MKKVLFAIVACLIAAFMITSCGGSNTPRDVAEKAMKCVKNKDYDGLVKMVNVSDEEKESMAAMMKTKVGQNADESKDIKSYEFVDEQIDEEAGTAIVKFKVVSKDDSERTETMKLERNGDGQWLLSAKK